MGILARLTSLLKSNLNELINRAEDPEKMLSQMLLDMQGQLVEAKKQVAVAIADEKKLKKQLDSEVMAAAEWERKAMLAVKANNDALAREALVRQQEHHKLAVGYQQQWEGQRASVDQLKGALMQLSDRIEEAKRRKNLLVARAKRAEAQKTIAETMHGLQDAGAFETMSRMEDKINQLEAQNEATYELGAAVADTALDQQFKQLEAGGNADDALAALKAKMGLLGAPDTAGQLGPGKDDADAHAGDDAVDGEVEDERPAGSGKK